MYVLAFLFALGAVLSWRATHRALPFESALAAGVTAAAMFVLLKTGHLG